MHIQDNYGNILLGFHDFYEVLTLHIKTKFTVALQMRIQNNPSTFQV